MGEPESSEVQLVPSVPLANIGIRSFPFLLLLSARRPISTGRSEVCRSTYTLPARGNRYYFHTYDNYKIGIWETMSHP